MAEPIHNDLIEEAWQLLEKMILPASGVHPEQSKDMRRAFFSGAMALWTLMMQSTMLDDDAEPTDRDLVQMESVDNELKRFFVGLKLGIN